MSELAHQIRNYSNFTWLNGSFLLDWLIHNIDISCWIKQAWPVSAQGHGGRQVRTEPDQLFDHYSVEFTFADGTRMQAQGRHMSGCWDFFGTVVHGAKGSAILGEGIAQPRIYKSPKQTPENLIWQHKGPEPNAYQVEHDVLFDAIRQDKPYNETEFSVKSAMAGILGRMAAESGKMITWDEALASNLELAPGLDQYTMASDAAGDARCPGPLPHRDAGHDQGAVRLAKLAGCSSPTRGRLFRLNPPWMAEQGKRPGIAIPGVERRNCFTIKTGLNKGFLMQPTSRVSRRTFLQTSAAVMGGSAAVPTLLAATGLAGGEDWKMRLATSSIQFSSLPVEKACERIASLGFEAVDFWPAAPRAYAEYGCRHLEEIEKRLVLPGSRSCWPSITSSSPR